jgi:putative transposase
MDLKVVNSVVPVTKETFATVMHEPERLFDMMQLDFRQIAEATLSGMLKAELTSFLGRQVYGRSPSDTGTQVNYRNGYYNRKFGVKNLGELQIKVPRDRNGEFETKLIAKYERYDQALKRDVCAMFLSGCSTRAIELMSQTVLGRKISRGEVSAINQELLTGIENWRCRDLHDFKVKYMYVDGVFFKMRVEGKVERIPMLIVIGVTEENRRVFLCIQQGNKDSAVAWRQIFRDLKNRGLDGSRVKLGVMDGLPGLDKVFSEEFSEAKVQRCQVHVARNVLSKVAKQSQQKVADHLRSIFYAPDRQTARKQYEEFYAACESESPSAVKCLEGVLENCLTFMSFPSEDWVSLRTTNPIERVNKEFKRRTNSMEILSGEKSAYRLLCFIALKMEVYWQRSPINRTPNRFELGQFTQLC